jgi:hypothetical protein
MKWDLLHREIARRTFTGPYCFSDNEGHTRHIIWCELQPDQISTPKQSSAGDGLGETIGVNKVVDEGVRYLGDNIEGNNQLGRDVAIHEAPVALSQNHRRWA